MLKDFRAFIARGNVLDLAVGVIIGGAFATITKSLTDDVIMPIVGALFGGFDFSSYFFRLGPVPADYKGSLASYAQLKAAGVPLLGYGEFITVVINFLILAFIVVIVVAFTAFFVVLAEVDQHTLGLFARQMLIGHGRDELRQQCLGGRVLLHHVFRIQDHIENPFRLPALGDTRQCRADVLFVELVTRRALLLE